MNLSKKRGSIFIMIKIIESLPESKHYNYNMWIGEIQRMYLGLMGSEINVPLNEYVKALDYKETNNEIVYKYKELVSKYDAIQFDYYLESNLITIFNITFGYVKQNIKIIFSNDDNRIVTVNIKLTDNYENDTSLDDLNLSVRTYNCLRRFGVLTVGDIKNINLKKVRGLGYKGINELKCIIGDIKYE